MGKFFNLDSPFMQGLNKVADLMIVNLCTLIFFVPAIVIGYGVLAAKAYFWFILCIVVSFPCGAALTALNYVCLKIVRNEETYIIKSFFRSFKENFGQATILWLIKCITFALIAFDLWIAINEGDTLPGWMGMALIAISGLIFALGLHVFPLQAKFVNSIPKTIKNSVLVGIMIFPKTLLMMIVWVVPYIILIYFPQIIPLVILLGVSGPAFVCALLYNKTFKKFEPQVEDKSPDDWTVEMPEEEEEKLEEKEEKEQN